MSRTNELRIDNSNADFSIEMSVRMENLEEKEDLIKQAFESFANQVNMIIAADDHIL